MNAENYDLTAKISSNSSEVQVSLIEPGGTVRQKTVSIDDLITQLVSSHRISTDILPRGTRFYKGEKTDYFMGIELMPKKRFMQIDGGKRKLIPVPRCLFIVHIRKDRICSSWLFCLMNPFNSWNDPLFSFPYGNVYDHGGICWGTAAIPKITRPMDLIGALSAFFDSNFNGDLVDDYAFVSPDIDPEEDPVDNLWDLVKYVENMDEFPEDMLYRKNYLINDILDRRV
jgi:hypothetical protein